MTTQRPTVAIIGVGGVGGLFAARLLTTKRVNVVLFARGKTLAALRSEGLRFDSPASEGKLSCAFPPDRFVATDDWRQLKHRGGADIVLVCTKTWQVADVAESVVRHIVHDKSVVIPLQNGVQSPETLAAVLGKQRVLGGYCQLVAFALSTSPARIVHEAIKPTIGLGEFFVAEDSQDRAKETDRVVRLRDLFSAAGIEVAPPQDIRFGLWRKLMIMACMSCVGAAARASREGIFGVPETSEILKHCMYEVCRLARAHGVALADSVADQVFEWLRSETQRQPGATTSMMRDHANGRPSELDDLSGFIHRRGRELGVSTPVHSTLYAALLPRELKARGKLQFRDPADVGVKGGPAGTGSSAAASAVSSASGTARAVAAKAAAGGRLRSSL